MPASRRRIRRFATYTGVLLCVLLLGAWIATRWWEGSVGYAAGQKSWVVGMSQGTVMYGRMNWKSSSEPWRIRFDRGVYSHQALAGFDAVAGWNFQQAVLSGPRWVWLRRSYWGAESAYIWLPLWIPFVAITLTTGWLFYIDRRVIPGHCPKCRYDLVGNSTGVCPECGQPLANNQA